VCVSTSSSSPCTITYASHTAPRRCHRASSLVSFVVAPMMEARFSTYFFIISYSKMVRLQECRRLCVLKASASCQVDKMLEAMWKSTTGDPCDHSDPDTFARHASYFCQLVCQELLRDHALGIKTLGQNPHYRSLRLHRNRSNMAPNICIKIVC
jgi:hypothetical protein